MPTDQIVALLVAERDKLNRAIEALGSTSGKRRGRPAGAGRKSAALIPNADIPTISEGAPPPAAAPMRRRRKLSAAGRAAIAAAARKRWKLIKAGKAASPFAKRAKRKAA